MIVRQLTDGNVLAISQESHADVSAQFAAHWGNDRFARLDPYESMVFGTTYHDTGNREFEAGLHIDPDKGLPYNFRAAPPELRKRDADVNNWLWIRDHDPYAGLVVSVHHAGLRKRRYDTVGIQRVNGSAPASGDGVKLGIDAAFEDLQDWQREAAEQAGVGDPSARELFWHNYQMLQVFDILSLYLCCDGYDRDQLQEAVIQRVPIRAGATELVDLQLIPIGPNSLRIVPYPFDTSPLEVCVVARQMSPHVGEPAAAAKEAYHKGPRRPISWQLSS